MMLALPRRPAHPTTNESGNRERLTIMSKASRYQAFGVDPFAPGFYDDPYEQYANLREHAPVLRTPLQAWVVTRWEDVRTVLRRPSMTVAAHNTTSRAVPRQSDLLAEAGIDRETRQSRWILHLDPPDHTRLRRIVSKAFTPRAVERVRARTTELVDSLLDDLANRDAPVDLVDGLASPLPFAVISEMFGIPEGARDQLRHLSRTTTEMFDPLLMTAHAGEIIEAAKQMSDLVSETVTWKRGRDDDDLLTALIRLEDEGRLLSDDELIDTVVFLLLAAYESTVNLIGNGLAALLAHPHQLSRLVADPTLAVNATEELLRYDSPTQFARRIAMDSFELGGTTISAGDLVMTCLGAANRDPRKFGADADRLDLSRPSASEHVSFGSGVHHCLGMALARLEGQEAISRVVHRFPNLEAAGPSEPNGRLVLRGRSSLPVDLRCTI